MDFSIKTASDLQEYLRTKGVVVSGIRKRELIELCEETETLRLEVDSDRIVESRSETIPPKLLVLFTSDISGKLWNTCVWDINTGTSLMSYKGEGASRRGLCILGNQFLFGADCSKPLIHVWALQRKEQQHMKIICPGRVNCLDVTADGSYCIAAIAEKIYVWQVCSGNLMTVLTRHYQNVNVLKFTHCGSLFISGGEDNLIIVWSLARVLSCVYNPAMKPEPERIWSSHSLPITDIHVGYGGNRARVVSASLDQTCKIWDLVSGGLLQTLVFPTSVMSTIMDNAEYRLFTGTSNGDVYCVNMYGQPFTKDRLINAPDQTGVACFKGHSKPVTCLSISMDGTKLVSGSDDNSVKIWDVFSGQCIRTLGHKGQVSNAFIVPTPNAFINTHCKPTIHIEPFKRHLYTEGDDNRVNVYILGDGNTSETNIDLEESEREWRKEATISALQEEIQKLKSINQELYSFTVNEVLKQ